MPLTPTEQSLIIAAQAAIDAITSTPVPEIAAHTVGAAALSSTGRVFTGVNFFHFLGGVCAENGAFAMAAAAGVASSLAPGIDAGKGDAGKENLVCVVAVTNDSRGVINPCGRCRQFMFDSYPDIRVIVNEGKVGESKLRIASIKELLPFAYKSTFSPGVIEA
ncbi:uncharacterized protein BP5553_02375 [Venustampulla echinocandica]|uniref:CMP/dCMP-type deaminase domain-containing protein n=1 Tax=Venustampulla echinocandica TaxID=2656787 RepID=A0A370U3Q0_9HELO|nr:uncharacterized protein BP5553_02375 [Venustampulla echinocandica]RDL42396.1 hypothetical protein BP5553_02375 [Venustampulla echinocandica]